MTRMIYLLVRKAIGEGADAAPLLQAAIDGGAEMDAAIQARDARLFGCSPEAREGARL